MCMNVRFGFYICSEQKHSAALDQERMSERRHVPRSRRWEQNNIESGGGYGGIHAQRFKLKKERNLVILKKSFINSFKFRI